MAFDMARETALKILYEVNHEGAYSNISLNKNLGALDLKPIDKAFITDIVYGTIKWRLTVDWIIQKFSSIKIKKMSPWILNILRMGVYQLYFSDKVPPSAACNESVNLAKRYGHSGSSKFVNAVLRNIARNKEKIIFPDLEKDTVSALSVRYSHPEWMVNAWIDRFGKEFTQELLESNNQIPELSVRTNTLKISKDDLKKALASKGLDVHDGRYIDEAVVIKNPSSITALEEFKKGFFQVQDESSMLVSKILDPKKGECILDVCSAPGGKATHMAELMSNEGNIIARDLHEHKVKLINATLERLGLDIVKAETYDALEMDTSLVGKVDRVLVDAPCSGLGIIRRKPDIKWTRNEKDKKEIVKIQKKILQNIAHYVKPGGILVYSTCTIEPEENMEVVTGFLDSHKNFELTDISDQLPAKLQKESAKKGYLQIYSNIDLVDGFFIAKMKKRG